MAGALATLLVVTSAVCVASLNRSQGDCLCLFDVDRTLTGQQDLTSPKCSQNQVHPGIKDTAYGGGDLTLSQVGQSFKGTFCTNCFVGIVTAGDVSGANSQERAILVQHLQSSGGKLPVTEWSGPSKSGEARRACTPQDAQSTLVTGCLDGTKQEAAKGIVAWLASRASIPLSNVWLFDDRSMNIKPFRGTGMNAKQISCATRNPQMQIGVCGATTQEILPAPGVSICADEEDQVVV
ncbi:Esyt3 [Symbiodinium natans]|uniref:Esyt3 protein n=1 Tax=Symbiodinium natans TaxID=878477 RepID=A0A812VA39_9DINO|nr:Esyt3 [Symbiodinium natans]